MLRNLEVGDNARKKSFTSHVPILQPVDRTRCILLRSLEGLSAIALDDQKRTSVNSRIDQYLLKTISEYRIRPN